MAEMKMWHPSIPETKNSPIDTTTQSFNRVWAKKGWKKWKSTAAKSNKAKTDQAAKESAAIAEKKNSASEEPAATLSDDSSTGKDS